MYTKVQPKFLTVTAALLQLIFATLTWGDDQQVQQPNSQLEMFVHGAYRAEDDYPFSFTDITSDTIATQSFGQEPAVILGRSPGITFYSDSGSNQGYTYFRLRGIDQTRINMTLDGVPLNEPEDQGAYFSNYYDLLGSVSTVQIIRGVGVTQNGTASYGGSILFDSVDLDRPALTNVGVGAGSYGTLRGFAEYNSGVVEDRGIYLRASQLQTDGYKDRSTNASKSVFYKLGDLTRSDSWTLSGFVGHQENELAYLGSTAAELQENRRANGNAEEDDAFTQSLVQLKNRRTFGSGDVLTTSLYYNNLQGNYDFDLNNFLGLPSTDELFNYRFRSHFTGAFSNYQMNFGAGSLTVGAHANWYERRHTGSQRDVSDLYENTGRKAEASVFTKGQYLVGDFLLFSDLQLRHTNFDYSGAVPLGELDWTFFNPKAGVTYLVTNDTNLYYSVGRTRREPTRNDIFLGNDDLLADEAGAPIIGTTEEETVIDHELGVRTRGTDWSAQLNGFYMDFDKELVLNGDLGPTGLPLTESVDRSYRTGAELEFTTTAAPNLSLTTSAAYLYSRIHEGDSSFEPVLSPEFIINQSIEKRWGEFSLRADLRHQSGSYIDFANANRIDGFTVVDLAAHYRFPRLELGLHLNNIFDEKYVSNGYLDVNGEGRYFAQAPANVFVSVTWKQ